MSTRNRNRVPQLLDPFVRLPPESSLLLLTGALDATPFWLIPRFLNAVLSGEHGETTTTGSARTEAEDLNTAAPGDRGSKNIKIVLVSWMRDWETWRTEGRRGGGIDIARLAQEGRFAFVDGLSELFTGPPSAESGKGNTNSTPQARSTTRPIRQTILPNRGGPIPSRTPVSAQSPQSPQPQPPPPSTNSQKGRYSLTNPSLTTAAETITTAISNLTTDPTHDRIFLILDAPTLLLATTPTQPTALSSFVLSLREKVHSTLLLAEADAPFLAAANSTAFADGDAIVPTPLEKGHAAFVVGQGHVARWVMGTRALDTGVARDVSGVLKVSRGGGWDESLEEMDGDTVRDGELEVLYFVQADGGVRVFERGGGDVG